ncbi:MAG: nucleotidyltransferase family protein, partial [Erysipelotrichaceae bacterium]
ANLVFSEDFGNQVKKIRESSQCGLLIALMPGHFDQRGEPAILDKWRRTAALLEYGADLVIELPFAHTVQGVTHFAQAAVETLSSAGVDTLAFASETGNLEELKQLSRMSFNADAIKEKAKEGTPYPKSYGLSAGAYYPFDILGIAYLRALLGKEITPLTYACDADPFTSSPSSWPLYYPFLRWKLLTQDHASLSRLFLFDEGTEHHLLKHTASCDTWDELMQVCVTRRYTAPRLLRVCAHLMVHTLKDEIVQSKGLTVLRILGFDDAGRAYLKNLKAQEIRVASRFNQLPAVLRELEYRSTLAYAAPLSVQRRNALVEREMGGPVIKTRKV